MPGNPGAGAAQAPEDPHNAPRPGGEGPGRRTQDGQAAVDFLADIEPFLFGKAITYVDLGAHVGAVMDALLASRIGMRVAHLVEPDPDAFAALQRVAEGIAERSQGGRRVVCHNLAVGAGPGRMTLRAQGTMTHAVAAPDAPDRPDRLSDGLFKADVVALDDLARRCGLSRVELLKIDVEGQEMAVLEGARGLLEARAIDVIYVEAGMDPDSAQQSYYRAIEDHLNAFGYRLFRIYEQKHEWIEDSPFLRRVNLAFLSADFAARSPYRLSRALFETMTREQAQAAELAALRQAQAEAHGRIAALQGDLEARQAEIAAEAAERRRAAARSAEHAQALERMRAEQAAAQAELADLRHDLAAQRAEAEAALVRIARRDAALAESASEIQAARRALIRAEQQATQRQEELKRMTERFEALRADLEARADWHAAEAAALRSSTSWRLTAPLRFVKDRLTGR